MPYFGPSGEFQRKGTQWLSEFLGSLALSTKMGNSSRASSEFLTSNFQREWRVQVQGRASIWNTEPGEMAQS